MATITSPTVTPNALLLLGYIGGSVDGKEYRLVDADPVKGECVFQHKVTRNRYKVWVAQVSGKQ